MVRQMQEKELRKLLFPLWTRVFLARLQSILRTVGRIKQKLYVTVSICTVYLLFKKLATGHQRRVAQQLELSFFFV